MKKKKVVLLNNMISPYRIPVYRELSQHFNLAVYVGKSEDNRKFWSDFTSKFNDIKVGKSWGFVLKFPKFRDNGIYDYWYLHLTPGYFFDLIRENPDAVITTEFGARTFIAQLYGLFANTPVWIWWGGTIHTESSRGLAKRIFRKMLSRLGKNWISYGETSTEYLISLGIPRSSIVQLQNCVDENLFNQKQLPIFDIYPKPVFLYAGQLIKRKGVDKLIQAASILKKEGQEFSLILVGEGSEKEELISETEKMGLSNVFFYPYQSPDVMSGVYRSANFFIFPTLADPWGLVVNEALLCGVPVLSSKYAGCAIELLPPENIFDPLQIDDFVDALKKAMKGEISPPTTDHILSYKKVSHLIIEDIKKELLKAEANVL